ncbi:DUF2958 domain-containing protein [Sphingomonas sp.]|uniref:DUF2958 domain-containing protein n=1 Tax=Sphingomonas sp. TaxID=28214 RepID=UPI0025DF66FA|nr:DUF2958 domain-containing protein [Sphingomonas sp.]
MSLLSPADRAALAANHMTAADATARGAQFDPVPLVKLFNPFGAATWLATELAADGDTLFGLADLGMGSPELGYFSLAELEAVRLPFELAIERDRHFTSDFPLSVWAGCARTAGSILWAETLLRRVAQGRRARQLPSDPAPGTGG